MVFNENGIDLDSWKKELDGGDAMSIESFIENIRGKNLRNSLFVDVTANELAEHYDKLLSKSISVVACNKIACSSSFEYYKTLKILRENSMFPFYLKRMLVRVCPLLGL